MKQNEIDPSRTGYLMIFIESSNYYYGLYKQEEHILHFSASTEIDFSTDVYKKDIEKTKSIFRNYLTSFIYISLFIEAYIFDYGDRRLEKDFVGLHLDKLDTVSKWIVIPKMITGKQLDKSRHSFEVLKKVVKIRNKIIHHKTVGLIQMLRSIDNYKPLNEEIKMIDIYDALKDIFKQLDEFDKKVNHSIYLEALTN